MSGRTRTEWPIGRVAKAAGTTSRTLRHYEAVGLLAPSRIGANGYRYYDDDAVVRLQRIRLLRALGLGLGAIADVLRENTDTVRALTEHIGWLESERERLGRQITSVRRTLAAIEHGEELRVSEMFEGFDHKRYEDEVVKRWGKDAYARSSSWWEAKSAAEKADFQQDVRERSRAWAELAASGAAPDGPEAAELAAAHVAWLKSVPGTPASDDPSTLKSYVVGLADMYAADSRFAANYGGTDGAAFVRRALRHYAEREL